MLDLVWKVGSLIPLCGSIFESRRALLVANSLGFSNMLGVPKLVFVSNTGRSWEVVYHLRERWNSADRPTDPE